MEIIKGEKYRFIGDRSMIKHTSFPETFLAEKGMIAEVAEANWLSIGMKFDKEIWLPMDEDDEDTDLSWMNVLPEEFSSLFEKI